MRFNDLMSGICSVVMSVVVVDAFVLPASSLPSFLHLSIVLFLF